MQFKDFFLQSEDSKGGDNGILGFPIPSPRTPSAGQAFKANLSSVAASTPRKGSAGSNVKMMKKYMKKD